METRSYPYNEGDVRVLGPQIFVGHKPNGTPVINWQGENFEPQRPTLRVRLHNLIVRLREARP
jgi:hypothetical protein